MSYPTQCNLFLTSAGSAGTVNWEQYQQALMQAPQFYPRYIGGQLIRKALAKPIIPPVEPETHGLDIDACKPPLRDR